MTTTAAADGTFTVVIPEGFEALDAPEPSAVIFTDVEHPMAPAPAVMVRRVPETKSDLGSFMALQLATSMVSLTDAHKVDAQVLRSDNGGDELALYMVTYRQGIFGMTLAAAFFDRGPSRFAVAATATNDLAALAHDLCLEAVSSVALNTSTT